MRMMDLGKISHLDRVRLRDGSDKLKSYYSTLIKSDIEKALHLANDDDLSFATLFLLRPLIDESGILSRLNLRNQNALEISRNLLAKETSRKERLSLDDRQLHYPVLKWMLETGRMEDGLSNDYDEVLDMTTLTLIKTHKDKTVLPAVADMIFDRYRRGLYIYDLVWAFFEACDPDCLAMVAYRLNSNQLKDVELARKLLNFIPCISMNSYMNPTSQYACVLNWLQENYPYLYYTGDSFQQSSNPVPYTVSLDAKYLCKALSTHNENAPISLSDEERRLVDRFKTLDSNTRVALSRCSYLLNRQNKYWWNMWLRSPLQYQIEVARRMVGGLS